MLPPQKPATLQQGGILVSSLGKRSLPWPLQMHWRQPAFRKAHGRPGVQEQTFTAQARRQGCSIQNDGQKDPPSLQSSSHLRGTQCITVLITSWALGRNTPKEAFLSTPHPQCRAGGPEWTPVIMAPAGAQGEREGSWVPAVCLLPQQDKQGSRAPTLGTKGRGQNPPPVSPKTANMLPQRLS